MTDFSQALSIASSGLKAQSARLRHVSENIANADTPGYRARDVADFQETWRNTTAEARMGRAEMPMRVIDAGTPSSPNGNSVSLEFEMLRGIEAQRAHSRAMRVYGSAMTILRASIGR